MAGNRTGGIKAAAANKEREPGFYARIDAIGGKNGKTGGFAANIECDCDLVLGTHYKQRCAGVRGGLKSRRSKTLKGGDNA